MLVTIPPEKAGDTGAVLRLYPGPNADSFIGTDRDPQDGSIFAILLVKQSSGLSLKSLDGQYLSHGIEADTQTYSAGTSAVTVGDFEFRDESVSVTFDGTSPRTFTAQAHVVSRDGSVAGGVSVTDESPSTFSGAVTLSSTGAYRVSTSQGSVMGAVSPDLEFGFFVSDINDTRGGHLFEPFVKPPPAK